MNTDLWKYCTKEQCRTFILSMNLLGNVNWTEERQLACLYSISNHTEQHYNRASILKKDGSKRHLLMPDPLLKGIQRNLLHHILDQIPISIYATAYQKKSDIRNNAAAHLSKKQVLNLDIKDFFDTIVFYMVYQAAFPRIYFPPAAASLLTHLCCVYDRLPQGAPTSAAISNLVMKPFDDYMGNWCEQQSICYTRYCDDMTFSGEFDAEKVKRRAGNFLSAMGFSLNHKKTRVRTVSMRQVVTGIVVNEKLQVSREYRRKLRQEIYYIKKYGVVSHLKQIEDQKYLPIGEEGVKRYLRTQIGKVNYVLHINPEDAYFKEAVPYLKSCLDTKTFL